jgi:transposase
MPAKCPDLSQWAEEDFRDAEAIAEAVQRPTMKFVASTTEQLDLSVTGRTLRLDQEPEASRVGARDGTVRSSGWNREV